MLYTNLPSILGLECTGVDIWYYNGKKNKPAIIFATGRHGNISKDSKSYIIYPNGEKFTQPEYLFNKDGIPITGMFSNVIIKRNYILFTGTDTVDGEEYSRLYLISPTTKIVKLIRGSTEPFENRLHPKQKLFIPKGSTEPFEKRLYPKQNPFAVVPNFSARTGLIIKEKHKPLQIIIAGNGIQIYKIENLHPILEKSINLQKTPQRSAGICYSGSTEPFEKRLHPKQNPLTLDGELSVGIRRRTNPININGIAKYSDNSEFVKSWLINLKTNVITEYETNMQCTAIYHDNNVIVFIGSGQPTLYSQCFMIIRKTNERINLGQPMDGRNYTLYNSKKDLFILCVTSNHLLVKDFKSNLREMIDIPNINSPCRGCCLYENSIVITSLKKQNVLLTL